ncbi:MAG: MFS transporter [Actinomycetota bacterium]|nr:MFS transporter [Actinomycetota bacterium]
MKEQQHQGQRTKVAARMRIRAEGMVGGAARLKVIVLLAAVLSLTTADLSTIGATAPQLEMALHINNTDIGLLVTASSGIGVLTTIPFGVLADRVRRVRLLLISIVAWSVMVAACAAAPTYTWLLTFRLLLGAAIAGASPLIASLTGDLFEPAERGRIYGYILSGELVGAGFGLLICGDLSAAVSWRAPFALMAVLGLGLAWTIRGVLPEPARGGASRLAVGASDIPTAQDIAHSPAGEQSVVAKETVLDTEVRRAHIPPRENLQLRQTPEHRSIWWAARYVLSVRTNVVLIIASSLGYFFLSGMQTYAILFARGRFGLTQNQASLMLVLIGGGSIVGLLIAGRLSDSLIARHHIAARPLVAAVGFLTAVAFFIPALLTTTLWIAFPLIFLGIMGIGGANPPLDAARLDIMPSPLWGRAESVRSVLRKALEAGAPLLFGWVSTQLGGSGGGFGHPDATQPYHAIGLDRTLLLMLIPLAISGLLLLFVGRRTYPRDVATAVASEKAIRHSA